MEEWIADSITGLDIGQPQSHRNLTVFPLLDEDTGPEYLTLGEALDEGLITVTEVGESGAVSKLRVKNEGEVPVLLLDGEELAGAKQNRVLNTTIFVPANSEVIVPVSCTEQGRWSYRSRGFEDSGHAMPARHRGRKSQSVSESLESEQGFTSDQREVWDGVDEMQAEADASSPTDAMRDVYEDREDDLRSYLDAFGPVDGQHGLLAVIGGRPVGFDVLSRSEAYGRLHAKLVKSYAMDAILREEGETAEPDEDIAEAFLREAAGCEGRSYDSPGHGTDWRFQGDRLVGSALTFRKVLIHAAFFRVDGDEGDETGRMSSFRRRRGFRQ